MAENIVYSRFEKTRLDGTKVKLRIQDMRDGDEERIIDFMEKWFQSEEHLAKGAGVDKSEEALKELRTWRHEMYKNKLEYPLVCYLDDEDPEKMDIVGCNCFYLLTKGAAPDQKAKNKELQNLFRLLDEISKEFDVLTKLNVDSSLGGAGLAVDPSYRGCGIATELLLARKPMMAVRNVPVTYAWFTAIPSQKAAKKAGYEELAELTYEELSRRTGVVFKDDAPKTTKLYALRA